MPTDPTVPSNPSRRLRQAWRRHLGGPGTLGVLLLLAAAALAIWQPRDRPAEAQRQDTTPAQNGPVASASRQARDLETLRAQATLQGLDWRSGTAGRPAGEPPVAPPSAPAQVAASGDWQVEIRLAGERQALRHGIAVLVGSLPHARVDRIDLQREGPGDRWEARVQVTLRYRRPAS